MEYQADGGAFDYGQHFCYKFEDDQDQSVLSMDFDGFLYSKDKSATEFSSERETNVNTFSSTDNTTQNDFSPGLQQPSNTLSNQENIYTPTTAPQLLSNFAQDNFPFESAQISSAATTPVQTIPAPVIQASNDQAFYQLSFDPSPSSGTASRSLLDSNQVPPSYNSRISLKLFNKSFNPGKETYNGHKRTNTNDAFFVNNVSPKTVPTIPSTMPTSFSSSVPSTSTTSSYTSPASTQSNSGAGISPGSSLSSSLGFNATAELFNDNFYPNGRPANSVSATPSPPRSYQSLRSSPLVSNMISGQSMNFDSTSYGNDLPEFDLNDFPDFGDGIEGFSSEPSYTTQSFSQAYQAVQAPIYNTNMAPNGDMMDSSAYQDGGLQSYGSGFQSFQSYQPVQPPLFDNFAQGYGNRAHPLNNGFKPVHSPVNAPLRTPNPLNGTIAEMSPSPFFDVNSTANQVQQTRQSLPAVQAPSFGLPHPSAPATIMINGKEIDIPAAYPPSFAATELPTGPGFPTYPNNFVDLTGISSPVRMRIPAIKTPTKAALAAAAASAQKASTRSPDTFKNAARISKPASTPTRTSVAVLGGRPPRQLSISPEMLAHVTEIVERYYGYIPCEDGGGMAKLLIRQNGQWYVDLESRREK